LGTEENLNKDLDNEDDDQFERGPLDNYQLDLKHKKQALSNKNGNGFENHLFEEEKYTGGD
jgi:hypothetical protein